MMKKNKYSLKILLEEFYTPDSDPRPYEAGYFDPAISLLYTSAPVNMTGQSVGERVETNRMYNLKLKEDTELTPEILVDFWYYDNRFEPKKAKNYYPVRVEVLGDGRQPTGEIYDLTSVPDNPRQA